VALAPTTVLDAGGGTGNHARAPLPSRAALRLDQRLEQIRDARPGHRVAPPEEIVRAIV
jgi:hypothetical protein